MDTPDSEQYLVSDSNLIFGGVVLPAGAYKLYRKDGWFAAEGRDGYIWQWKATEARR